MIIFNPKNKNDVVTTNSSQRSTTILCLRLQQAFALNQTLKRTSLFLYATKPGWCSPTQRIRSLFIEAALECQFDSLMGHAYLHALVY